MSEDITRALWQCLTTNGDPVDITATVAKGSVRVEADESCLCADLYFCDDGIDVRVGDLQFVVKGQNATVMQSHPPYPITRWTVLWEGKVA